MLFPASFLLSFLALLPVTLSQTNIIRNGDFSLVQPGTVQPSGWQCSDANFNASDCGSGSPPNTTNSFGYVAGGFTLFQGVSVGSNLPYLVEYVALCVHSTNNSDFRCNCTAHMGSKSAAYAVEDVNGAHLHALFLPNETSVDLGFSVSANSTWKLYVTNVTLWPLANSAPFTNTDNVMKDGGFETSTDLSGQNGGWGCTPSGSACCAINTINMNDTDLDDSISPQFAAEGLAYGELRPGCNLIQTLNTTSGNTYDLNLYAYCMFDDSACIKDNLSVNMINSGNSTLLGSGTTTFTVQQGNPWTGPYQLFKHTFTATGADTLSISSLSHLRIDNFTLFSSTPPPPPVAPIPTKHSTNVAAIAGGAAGGAVALVLLVGSLLFWKRKQLNQTLALTADTTPFVLESEKSAPEWPPSPSSIPPSYQQPFTSMTPTIDSHGRVVSASISVPEIQDVNQNISEDPLDPNSDRYPRFSMPR